MNKKTIINALKLPFRFDADRLTNDLKKLEKNKWIAHFVPANYEGDWSVIPLYSIDGKEDNIIPDFLADASAFRETSLLNDCSYFKEVIDTFECPKSAVRLMKLAKGSNIKEHVDIGLSMEENEVRVHVPVMTNPGVRFVVNRENVVMGAGECWYIDACLPHSVANNGDEDRIHIVMDLEKNDWLKNKFDEAGYVMREKDPLEKIGVRFEDVDAVLESLKMLNTDTANEQREIIKNAKKAYLAGREAEGK